MKKIAIIYNCSLKEIQGINYVNNSFVEGAKYFKDKNLVLSSIFSPYEVFECKGKTKLDIIGSDIREKKYIRKRRIRIFLREILSSNYLFGAYIKYYLNHIRTAKKAVKKFISRQDEYDYIIFQDINSAYVYLKNFSSNKRKKTILILHCSKELYEQARLTFPALFKNKYWSKRNEIKTQYVFDNIDKVIYLSQRAVDCSPVSSNKKTYIFNGEEDLHKHEYTEVHNPINMTCVGSMAWRKGQDIIIKAMSQLPKNILDSYKLHLIGSGAQMQELKEAVVKYNLEDHVCFYGNRNDVPELLKDMDIFIMPSLSEGLPMSMIEAIRQGMYVIGTDTGAIPEMIAPKCGKLVERDPNKIAETLTNVINDKCITIEMKKAAREHYLNNFTLKCMIYNYSDVLYSL